MQYIEIQEIGTSNKLYSVGMEIDGLIVDVIKEHLVYIQGDPLLHYCGFSKTDLMLFSINAYCHCEIIYKQVIE